MAETIKKGGTSWVPPVTKKKIAAVDNEIITCCRRELLNAKNNHSLELDEESMQNLVSAYKKLSAFIEQGGFKRC